MIQNTHRQTARTLIPDEASQLISRGGHQPGRMKPVIRAHGGRKMIDDSYKKPTEKMMMQQLEEMSEAKSKVKESNVKRRLYSESHEQTEKLRQSIAPQ